MHLFLWICLREAGNYQFINAQGYSRWLKNTLDMRMQKKEIRCLIKYENVAQGIYNYKVFLPLKSGWNNNSLVTCTNCGELFVIDWENPETENLSVKQIAGSTLCPTCNVVLCMYLADYPATIRISENQFGSFNDKAVFNQEEESEIVEFYELRPSPKGLN